MASLRTYQNAAGEDRYSVRYTRPDGKPAEKRGFRLKRDARAWAEDTESSKRQGLYVDVSKARQVVGELGPAWLENKRASMKPSAWRSLESAWRLHVEPEWGRRAIGMIRFSEVEAWIARLAKLRSATTVIRAHGVLAGILDVAVRDRRIQVNPARDVKLPRKVRKEHRYLTAADVSRLAIASKDNAVLVLVLAYCGLRWGEAAGLRVKDLDLLRRRINVTQNAVEVGDRIEVGTPKTHKRRSVPFPSLLTSPLAQACNGKGRDDLVFTSPRGGFVKRSRSDTGWFQAAVRAANLPTGDSERLTPHTLRHTAASLAIASGANVKAVQRMMGHASAAMTLDVYADLFDDDLDPVADRLNAQLAGTEVGRRWAEAPLSLIHI